MILTIRIVVTGGRDYSDRAAVFETLDLVHGIMRVAELGHGAAPGADALAAQWCRARGVACIPYRAEWRRYGLGAGPVRNRRMLHAFRPDAVLAFPGGDGTADCVAYARRIGIHVIDARSILGRA